MPYVSKRLKSSIRTRKRTRQAYLKYSHFVPQATRKQPWNREDIPVDSIYAVEGRKAFWKTECSICGGRALYRAGSKVYCRVHRAEAVKYWSAKPMRVPYQLHEEG